MRTIVAMMAALAMAQNANAEIRDDGWVKITEARDKTRVYIKPQSIKDLPAKMMRNFPVREAWIEKNYQFVKGTIERRVLTLEHFDCSGQRYTPIYLIKYRADGEAITNMSFSDYESDYRPVVPGTIWESVIEVVCGLSQ